MTDTLRGAIYSHLVGNAIGVRYESGHHIETVEVRGHGSREIPIGLRSQFVNSNSASCTTPSPTSSRSVLHDPAYDFGDFQLNW